jgi:UDP-N-acetylmuramoylalanine--D-glutamate ligase
MTLQVVLGLGRSGIGAARLLHQGGERVLVLDSGDQPVLQERAESLRREGISVQLNTPLDPASFTALPERPLRVIVSPGIRWDHPALLSLRQQGIHTDGEITTAWEATAGIPWIGITGTNGKTTVTHLVAHLLQAAGLDAPMCGNVGYSAAELALERANATAPNWLVVELSSYQIESAPRLAPRIGVWTTLTPDHLERHGSLDNYRAIKRSLLERSEVRILNGDDPDLRSRATSWDHGHWITAGSRQQAQAAGIEPALWIEADQICSSNGPLLAATALAMPGAHNRQNMLLAVAVGLRERDGVAWFNDSKATNYDAAEVALRALEGPLVVIAGGEAKQGDADGWLAELQRQAKAVVLFGAARTTFEELLNNTGYSGAVHSVEAMAEAVPLAGQLAAQHHCRGVLLSPACASFDQYQDFEARGEHFRQLVQSL